MSTNKSQPADDSPQSLVRSTSILSLGTLSSRILGFARDAVLAIFLGTGMKTDAFVVAFRIPNLLRELVGEGASHAAVVPVFAEYVRKNDSKEMSEFMTVIFTWALLGLGVVTTVGILLSPLIVRLMAPGFISEPDKLNLTVQLTRIMFPYLVLIGLTAYAMGILYTLRSFAVPAFAPCLLNIVLIVSVLAAWVLRSEVVYGLALGVLIGGFLQLAVQVRAIFKKGLNFIKPKTFRHSGVYKIGKLLGPRVFGAAVYELNVFIDTFCASLAWVVGAGGIAAIYFANRVVQFPMGIIGVAMAAAALPTFSSQVVANDLNQLRETLVFSLKNVFFLMFPTSVILMVLSMPVVRVLFERGEFNVYSTSITSLALLFYSVGLFSFAAVKILVMVFYAFQNTKTPVKVALLCLGMNAVLNFALMGILKVGGIALASSLASIVNFLILFSILDKKLGGLQKQLEPYLIKIFLATMVTAFSVFWFWMSLPALPLPVRVALAAIGGYIIYAVTCYLFKIEQIHKLCVWLQQKIQSKKI